MSEPLVVPCTLACAPYELVVDSVFWHTLAQKKLQEFRLNEGPFSVEGHFEIGYFRGSPCRVSLDFGAFENHVQSSSRRSFPVQTQLHIYNTVERFKERLLTQHQPNSELQQRGQWLKQVLLRHNVELRRAPNQLLQMLMLVHADLKKHLFRYRVAFPVMGLEPTPPKLVAQPCKLKSSWSEIRLNNLMKAWDVFSATSPDFLFVAQCTGDEVTVLPVSADVDLARDDMFVCVCDPCTAPLVPGWPLRSALALVAAFFIAPLAESRELQVICFRDRVKGGKRKIGHSVLLRVEVTALTEENSVDCKVWGWETMKKPWHSLDLSASMDSVRLAESAVGLNLELMRWRLVPQLNLSKVSQSKCLLFGAGTLGCNVARQLLAWGVRHISLVDNGIVAYSNPVRQSLFQHDDCKDGGKPKAVAAADALRRIFPGITATGYVMSVPMPGHSVSASTEHGDSLSAGANSHVQQVQRDCETVETLVKEHDVIFLLLDSREGRWLPTLLARKHKKLVINSALGFDSYLVMRHGILAQPQDTATPPETFNSVERMLRIPGDALGCYFCSDVIGPTNSMRDRTLDQQCTVTRPGLSMIAAGLAVELMVSILQHAQGGLARADSDDDYFGEESPLGLVPHQIRGFISRHCTLLPSIRAFSQCTACSDTVLKAYESDGFQFLLKTFDDSSYLEEITGLKKLHEDTNCMADIESWSDEDSVDMEAAGTSA